ncbi:MAG: glycosyltransferase family 39 protein [Acidobacteriia bacterium]|nr:glycosyltransferase family 39 protein [Terriglobia bacterium]MBV8906207.1 glycosyltransferase family 39 protein [Terriglobia bacterium]
MFVASALFIGWCSANRFVDNIDEGIYLDAGWRMAQGQVPYRDFFQYLAPGTFAVLATLFKIFGHSLAVSRAPVVVDLALMTASIFLLVSRLATRFAAALAALCFLAFETFNTQFIVANHRWDSSALALAAMVCGFFLLEQPRRLWALAAGISAGLAACTTWSLGLLCMVLLGWLLCDRSVRCQALTYLAGVCVAPAVVISWLAWNRALVPMMEGVLWSARNYAGPNRTAYGLVIGGYSPLFRHAGLFESSLMCTFLISATLPATAPILCLVGWPPRLRSHAERRIVFLLICAAAIVASTWPRPDMTHLMYVSALPYVLTFTLLARALGRNGRLALASVLLLVATSEIGYAIYQRLTEPWLTTRVGAVHGKPEDLAVLAEIQANVPPGRTLFVFPYWPVFYFTTGATNPTRYCYLQPGMFTKADERQVLRALSAHPPENAIYRYISKIGYLRIWPGSDPARLSMPEIEEFLAAHYVTVARPGKFRILRRKE